MTFRSESEETKTDGAQLETIAQALYVLKCFEDDIGLTESELTETLSGESHMARAYLIYFVEMHWLKKSKSEERWFLTADGKRILDALAKEAA